MLSNLWEKWSDFGYDHPHLATLLVILLIILFIVANIYLYLWPFIILMMFLIAGGVYFFIYSIFSGDF